jgi:hypothetical protein
MKIAELIKILQKMPQDAEVVGAHNCSSYPGKITVYKSVVVGSEWADDDEEDQCGEIQKVVVIDASP